MGLGNRLSLFQPSPYIKGQNKGKYRGEKETEKINKKEQKH
jgi:hypothetical protein